MMYTVEFSKTAEKQFYKLPHEVQVRVLRVFERIKVRPFHFVKRKEGTSDFIARIGEYRAVLDINKKRFVISVMELGHRKNIYD